MFVMRASSANQSRVPNNAKNLRERDMKIEIGQLNITNRSETALAGIGMTSLALASVAVVTAMGTANAADAAFKKKSPLIIGYSIQSAQDPYWQGYVSGIETEMKKYGFEKLLTQDSQASPQKQVSGSLALINSGISCLIVSPHEPKALAATIAAAHKEKIPVVVGDVGADGDYDGFVLSDNYHGGALAAEFVAKALADRQGVQEVAIISLNPTTSVNHPRTN